MPKSSTPSFIIELPLVVKPASDRVLLARLEAGRRLYNVVLQDALKRLDRMRQSKARQARLADLERRLAAARKRDHGELANVVLGLGNVIQTESLSYRSFQRNFGRSSKTRGPGMFIQHLKRKAESAGGTVVELNTRTLRMSQYDHVTGQCVKKPLNQRWHRLGDTRAWVQRDIYSAFLARNVEAGVHNPTRLKADWAAQEPVLRRAGLCVNESASGRPPAVPTVAVPSERIARRKRLERGLGPDAVAQARAGQPPVVRL